MLGIAPSEGNLLPEGVHWKTHPVQLIVTRTAEAKYAKEITEAIWAWNDAVGCEVLEWPKECTQNCVYVQTNFSHENFTELVWSPELLITRAYVSLDANGSLMRRVVTHELGHVLGLNHNEDPMTVMFFMALSSAWELSDGDVETLKLLYCK